MAISILTVACDDLNKAKSRYLESGKSYIKQKNYNKAKIEFKNVLQIDPKMAEAHYFLGHIANQQSNTQSAYSHYLVATQLDPELLGPHLELGKSYLDYVSLMKMNGDQKQVDIFINNAKDHIDKALQIAPENLDVQILQASLYAHQDNIKEAIHKLNLIIQKTPVKNDAITLLMRLYVLQGEEKQATSLLEKAVASSPDNEVLQLEMAKLYVLYGKNDQAIEVMSSIVKNYPEIFQYHQFLAQYYIKNNHLDEAEKVFRNALSMDLLDVGRYVSLFDFIEKNRDENAISVFLDSIYEQMPDNVVIKLWLANSYQKVKKYDKAISLYGNIIDNKKNFKVVNDARVGMATIYLSEKKLDIVKRIIEEILIENPNDADALTIKGTVAMQEEDYETAVICFNVILKTQPKSPLIINHLADSYYFMGKYALAIDTYSRILRIVPKNVILRLKLARSLAADNKNEQALELANNILEKDIKNSSALMFKSEVLASLGRTQELTETLGRIKQLMPDNPEGWFRMSRMYKSLKKYKLARDEMDIAWNKDLDSSDYLAELIDLEIKLEMYDQAKNRLKQLIAGHSGHPTAHKYLGAVYMAEQKLAESESEFILHMKRSPDDIAIYRLLADIRIRNGDLDAAESYYMKGLARSPDDDFLRNALEKLRMMRKQSISK